MPSPAASSAPVTTSTNEPVAVEMTAAPEFFDPFADEFRLPLGDRNGGRGAAIPNPRLTLFGEIGGRMGSSDPARAAGSNLTQVSFAVDGADFDPDVSRDGRKIVFASTQHRETPDLYIKSVDSNVVTQLTNDAASDVMPRLSPDGQRIAFASNRSGNWDIFVMPVTGGKAVQITTSPADDLHPSWSPDGSRLVFSRLGEVSGQWEMWVADVLNPGVAHFIGHGLFPEWCPVAGTGERGSDRILFQKSRERGDRLFSVWTVDYRDGEAGRPTELASSRAAACINPTWSPDGRWVAFATVPSTGRTSDARPPYADLWMIDLNGSSRIHLTQGRAVNLMPVWGSNNRLYFVSNRGGADNIWSLDVGGAVELAMGLPSGDGNTRTAGAKEEAPSAVFVTVPSEDR